MDFTSDLLALNSRGLFPGPNENDQNFLGRTQASIPGVTDPKALDLTQKLFDAAPDWVEVKIGSKGLVPWEGAATWIEENADGKRTASIQLKSSIPAKLYLPEEVLAHELVHAMRLGFEEDRFEEILAYRTSKNWIRRYCGPLFSKPKEVKWLLSLMAAAWVSYWIELIFDANFGGQYLIWMPSVMIGWVGMRLMRAQRTFSTALKNLELAIAKKGKSLAVALRLTDVEIALLSRLSPQEILDYAAKEKGTSLRWRQLFCAYFK